MADLDSIDRLIGEMVRQEQVCQLASVNSKLCRDNARLKLLELNLYVHRTADQQLAKFRAEQQKGNNHEIPRKTRPISGRKSG